MNTLRSYGILATLALGWLGFTSAAFVSLFPSEPRIHLIAPEIVLIADPYTGEIVNVRTAFASPDGGATDCCPN